MKLLGLTIGQLFAAILFGLLIAFAAVFMTAPHPVSVPVQVITPVPTPPPVVITQQPAPQATQIPDTTEDPLVSLALSIMIYLLPLVVVLSVFFNIMGTFDRRDDF